MRSFSPRNNRPYQPVIIGFPLKGDNQGSLWGAPPPFVPAPSGHLPASVTRMPTSSVVLLNLGAYAPPTVALLRAFERARDFVHLALGAIVVEGLLAPIPGTIHGVAEKHRIRMVEAAVRSSSWLRAACWQCSQHSAPRNAATVAHYLSEIRKKHGSEVQLFLLLGSDQLLSMGEAGGDWTASELETLLSKHSLLVMKRGVSPIGDVIYRNEVFRRHQHRIHLIEDETFPNGLSSTRVRTALERGESVRYCVDDAVLEYIQELHLFESVPQPPPPTPPSPPRVGFAPWRTPPPSDTSTQAGSCSSEGVPQIPTIFTGKQLFDLMDNNPPPALDSPLLLRGLELIEEQEKTVEFDLPEEREHCVAHVVVHSSPRKKKESPKKEEKKRKQRPPPLNQMPGQLSPDYDNVTLDELLAASTSWAEFMGKQKKELKRDECELPPAPPPPVRTGEVGMEKRRGWLCGKPKRQSDDSLIGICGTDRRKLGQLSPEIFRKWKKFDESDSPSPPQKPARKTQSTRFVDDPSPPIQPVMTQSLNEGNKGGVTLTFRRYQLGSAPETTV